MKVLTFHSLLLGVLCLSVAGLAAVNVIQHRQLQALAETTSSNSSSATVSQLADLSERQNTLQTLVADLRKALGSATDEQRSQAKHQEQLAAAVQTVRELPVPAAVDIGPLEARVVSVEQQLVQMSTQLEQRLATPKPVAARETVKPKPAPTAAAPTAPFTLVGMETRGSERFVSVVPVGDQSLHSVRLLQPGESLGSWQLQAINGEAAVFAIPSHTDQRIALPSRTSP